MTETNYREIACAHIDESIVAAAGFQCVLHKVDGLQYASKSKGLMVIISAATEQDGKVWVHLSLSRRRRMPTYEDMMLCKLVFLGEETVAYQVFVPQSEHINIMPYCLHLWMPVGFRPLPDFSRGMGSI